jgi:hypothetical protein
VIVAVTLWQCVQDVMDEAADEPDPVLVVEVLEVLDRTEMLAVDELVELIVVLVDEKLLEELVDGEELKTICELVEALELVEEVEVEDVEELVTEEELDVELTLVELELDEIVLVVTELIEILDEDVVLDIVLPDVVDEEDIVLVEEDVMVVEEVVVLVEEVVVLVEVELLETVDANKHDGIFTSLVLGPTRIATSELARGGKLLQLNVSRVQLPSVKEYIASEQVGLLEHALMQSWKRAWVLCRFTLLGAVWIVKNTSPLGGM